MQNQNPFEQILNKLDQIERLLIISLNAPKTKPKEEQSDPNRIINLLEAAKILRKPVGTVGRISIPAIFQLRLLERDT